MNGDATAPFEPVRSNRLVAFIDILGASEDALSGRVDDLVRKIFRLGKQMRWQLIKRSNQVFVAGPRSMFEHFVIEGYVVPVKSDAGISDAGGELLAINWALSVQELHGYQEKAYRALHQKLEEMVSQAGPIAKEKYTRAIDFLKEVTRRFPQPLQIETGRSIRSGPDE